jgi:hypothetical protein
MIFFSNTRSLRHYVENPLSDAFKMMEMQGKMSMKEISPLQEKRSMNGAHCPIIHGNFFVSDKKKRIEKGLPFSIRSFQQPAGQLRFLITDLTCQSSIINSVVIII